MDEKLVLLEKYIKIIAAELNITPKQVAATVMLLEEGGTVPFIARYRKEATGLLDEVAIAAIRDRLAQIAELDKRKEAILKSISEQGKLTKELQDQINAAKTMTQLEDIYLPYKPKRRTRATIAKEKGLEPLAKMLFEQGELDPVKEAHAFINKEVLTEEDALAGARDIIAEWISEDTHSRTAIRKLYFTAGQFSSKVLPGKEEDAVKYKDYYDYQESVTTAPSHRILAIRRGAKEKFLVLRVLVPEDRALEILESIFIKNETQAASQVKTAIADSFKRLMMLSMETEVRLETKKTADTEAIRVFAENLRQLLLASPLGQKNVMALDPGFRTGCKLVCLDPQGKLIYNDTIYPHSGKTSEKAAAEKIKMICERLNVEAIAIGNGTASRETENFINAIGLDKRIIVIMVNESGASIYSASTVARQEFPDQDITVRGSVSIGRRLMDPLAELVKIDAKSIGVGQYQHDVDQKMLKAGLDDTVISCVNLVGVEANTASNQLLSYVSGMGPQLAEKFVVYRNENGAFKSRKEFMNVPGLGAKTFEQSAGFLRIRDANNPLDASAVHPESYSIVAEMSKDINCSVADLIANKELRDKIDMEKYTTDKVGLPTLKDILSELSKPGRDPREKFEVFKFTDGVNTINDICEGMKLAGIVTNITAFGAFVDIGVHCDGLVHVSQLADKFVKDPTDIVKVHQKVTVTVTEIDVARKRIALSMRSEKNPPKSKAKSKKTKPKPKAPKPKSQKPKPKPKAPKPKSKKPLREQLTFGS